MRLLLLLEKDEHLNETFGEIARRVGGIEIRVLTEAPTGHEFVAAAVELTRAFEPDLIIVSWANFGAGGLDRIRGLSNEVWVLTAYPTRGRVHREAAEADLILSKNLVTMALLEALFQRAKQRWESRQPTAVG